MPLTSRPVKIRKQKTPADARRGVSVFSGEQWVC